VHQLKVASKFIKHVQCGNCGSSDANSLYDDGHQYCFACNNYVNGSGDEPVVYSQPKVKVFQMKTTGEVKAIVDRGITRETCEYFGVTQADGKHFYPYFDETSAKVAEQDVLNRWKLSESDTFRAEFVSERG
jgi:twinkle protein